MTSNIFQEAARQWHQMKSDYLSHVDAEYAKALEACAGVLVNNLGREQHVDGYNLFTGTQARADMYASEELKEYWFHTPRLSLIDYELQWMSGQIEFIGANWTTLHTALKAQNPPSPTPTPARVGEQTASPRSNTYS